MSRLIDAVHAVTQELIKQKDYLTGLDKAIADGDHGINMARGFNSINDELAKLDDINPKTVLRTMGKTLVATVGGAAGPLYGNGFIAASEVCEPDSKLTVETVEKTLGAAIAAIKRRGRSDQGDKTMLDALIPIHACFLPENSAGKSVVQCFEAAVKAARNGVLYTTTIPARKGRATYMGDGSIGHEDPGAVSSMIMCKTVYEFLNK